jgi:hypothetical protein
MVAVPNSLHYDPSYGKGPYGNQEAWENDLLAGFAKLISTFYIKKNDPNTTETDFVGK